jgi:NADH-quinone oxidoreductase subunit L
LVTAGITAFYMWRLYFLVFHGESRASKDLLDRVHEPAPVVTNPLIVLALLSALGGALGIPQLFGDWFGIESSHSLANFLSPVWPEMQEHHLPHATELSLTGLAVFVAGLGLLGAWQLYLARPEVPARLAARLAALYRLLLNKYYIDEIYDAVIVRPLVRVSDAVLFRTIDAGVIDGLAVNGTAKVVQGVASSGLRWLQSGLAQSYVASMLAGTAAILWYLLR